MAKQIINYPQQAYYSTSGRKSQLPVAWLHLKYYEQNNIIKRPCKKTSSAS